MSSQPVAPTDRSQSPPPIDAEIWARLRRFDPHCFISFTRTRPNSRLWQRARRTWQASMHVDGGKAWDHIYIEHVVFEEALRMLVEEGERRGWAR